MRLATKWADVRLKQYIQIVEVSAVDMDELDKQVKIISILSGESEDTILQMSLTQIKYCISKIQFIYTKPEGGHIKQYIKIKGNKFNINTDLRKITGGEYIDLTSLIKDKDQVTANLPSIISIFFKPVNYFGFIKKKCFEGDNQTLASRIKTAKLIEDHLTMDEVMTLSAFFLRSWNALTQATLDYSELELKKVKKSLNKLITKDFKNIGAGV